MRSLTATKIDPRGYLVRPFLDAISRTHWRGLPRSGCEGRGQCSPVLDICDGHAQSLDDASDLAAEIAVAIHVGGRDVKLRLIPSGREIVVELRERDRLLERERFATNCD